MALRGHPSSSCTAGELYWYSVATPLRHATIALTLQFMFRKEGWPRSATPTIRRISPRFSNAKFFYNLSFVTQPNSKVVVSDTARAGRNLVRHAELCFALAMRIVPRKFRFDAAMFMAATIVPFFRRTEAYREQEIRSPHWAPPGI